MIWYDHRVAPLQEEVKELKHRIENLELFRKSYWVKLPPGMKYEPINKFPIPTSVNWLGEKDGKEENGCVIYFDNKYQCFRFIDMLCELAKDEEQHD